METNKRKQKIKLQKIRDITLHHLKNHEGTEKGETTLEQLDNLEDDIRTWVKNFLLTCEELNVRPEITWVGEDGEFN